MNKLFYILLVVILGLLVGIGATVYIKNKNAAQDIIVPAYSDFSVTVSNKTGTKVILPNFLKDPAVTVDPQNAGLYFIGNTPASSAATGTAPTYVVTYEEKTGYFNITLLQKPFNPARSDAEAYIKNLLKVDELNLCQLSYTVSVPGYVDENASGIDYRFSFCPGSVTLP